MGKSRNQKNEEMLQDRIVGDDSDDQYYKRDTFRQVYVDKRHEATIALALDKEHRFKSLSEFYGTVLEILAEIVVKNEMGEKVRFTKEAEAIMEKLFNRGGMGVNGRGERNRWHNIRLDELRLSKISSGKSSIDLSRSQIAEQKEEEEQKNLDNMFKDILKSDDHLRKGTKWEDGVEEDNRPRSEMSESEVAKKEREELRKMKDQLAVPPKPKGE